MRKMTFLLGIISMLIILTSCAMPFAFLSSKEETRLVIETEKEVYTDEVINPNFYNMNDIEKLVSKNHSRLMPSIGDVNVLVIPVTFPNTNKEINIADINKGMFGKSEDTGWESLKSYYYKSSFGKLNINGTITDPFTTTKSNIYYEKDSSSTTAENKIREILYDALTTYDAIYDYKKFDANNDSVIDAVYLLYDHSIGSSNSIYWAWQDYYQNQDKWDGVYVSQFVWASIDFFYKDNSLLPTNKINSSTIIHETGHLLGIPDLYDYSPNEYDKNGNLVETGKGSNISTGGADMMHDNIGDHNGLTKTLLGWIKPKVVVNSTQIELKKYSEGDVIIIAPNWNSKTNILSEFYLVEFYNQTGLDAPYYYSGIGGGFSTKGVLIYHVNARIDIEPYRSNDFFSYDNSYTKLAFMAIVDNEGYKKNHNEYLSSDYYASKLAMFQENDTYTPSNSKQNVAEEFKKMKITVNTVKDTATLTIIFN